MVKKAEIVWESTEGKGPVRKGSWELGRSWYHFRRDEWISAWLCRSRFLVTIVSGRDEG